MPKFGLLDSMDFTKACREMFAAHRVEAFGGTFHVPAAREYSCLFSWDSGYHALALSHLDRAAAVEELRVLYASNTTDEGLLAHERPMPGAEARTKLVVEWLGPIYRPDGRSWLIDPPVGAFATALIYDPKFDNDTRLLDAATDVLLTTLRERTLVPGVAPVILHPLESGADASPLYDPIVDASSRRALLTSHHKLSVDLEAVAYDPAKARASGHSFIVTDPIFCGWCLLALEELADAWRRAGKFATANRLDRRAARLAQALVAELWCEDLAMFVGYDHVGQRQLKVSTLGGIILAASRNIIKTGHSAKVISAHLHPDTSKFWGLAGVAFNPLNGLEIDSKALLWRGDVVWGATQYWAYLVLSRNGFGERAAKARTQLEALITQSGFREYYSAQTGQGFGAGETGGFTWPALVLEMASAARIAPSAASPHS